MAGLTARTPILAPTVAPDRYVPKVQKHEESLQKMVAKYIRKNYPNVIFMSDYAAGIKLTESQAKIRKALQSDHKWLDMFLAEPRTITLKDGRQKHCCGLFIELKQEGTELKMRRNGTKVRRTKIKTKWGIRYESDYKIRLKGDWASLHIEEQAKTIELLNSKGYCATFGVGFDKIMRIIDWYMGKPESTTLF